MSKEKTATTGGWSVHNLAGLFIHLGMEDLDEGDAADAEARLSRYTAAATECGAEAHLVAPGERQMGTREERWSFFFRDYVEERAQLALAIRDGEWVFPVSVPPVVLDYIASLVGESIYELGAVASKLRGFHKLHRDGVLVAVEASVTVPVYVAHEGGVILGAAVTGCDKETPTHTLYFPFTDIEWHNALNEVEDEARAIYRTAYPGSDGPVAARKDPGPPEGYQDFVVTYDLVVSGTVTIRAQGAGYAHEFFTGALPVKTLLKGAAPDTWHLVEGTTRILSEHQQRGPADRVVHVGASPTAEASLAGAGAARDPEHPVYVYPAQLITAEPLSDGELDRLEENMGAMPGMRSRFVFDGPNPTVERAEDFEVTDWFGD